MMQDSKSLAIVAKCCLKSSFACPVRLWQASSSASGPIDLGRVCLSARSPRKDAGNLPEDAARLNRLRPTLALLFCLVFRPNLPTSHCAFPSISKGVVSNLPAEVLMSHAATSVLHVLLMLSLQLIEVSKTCLFRPSGLEMRTSPHLNQIKKYFELEPLARGKRWILEGSTINNMEAVRESFSQLIRLLEEKELRPGRI
ncbi:hypothetical protein SRHO_G00262150 [Serrasalmus rhombeus]